MYCVKSLREILGSFLLYLKGFIVGSKYKMRVTFEKGTTWITVNGSTWSRNKYPAECVDKFGDVWLKPYFHASNLYVTIQGPELLFVVENGCLEEN